MRSSSVTCLVGLLAKTVLGQGLGLTGYPANAYDPYCAMSCVRSLYGLLLSCSSQGDRVGMVTSPTSSECWATNTPYLTSLAWCMNTTCSEFDIPTSKLEWFWETEATGQSTAGQVLVPPKWSYAIALSNVNPKPPANQLAANDTYLNVTSVVSPTVYEEQWNVLTALQREGKTENGLGYDDDHPPCPSRQRAVSKTLTPVLASQCLSLDSAHLYSSLYLDIFHSSPRSSGNSNRTWSGPALLARTQSAPCLS